MQAQACLTPMGDSEASERGAQQDLGCIPALHIWDLGRPHGWAIAGW